MLFHMQDPCAAFQVEDISSFSEDLGHFLHQIRARRRVFQDFWTPCLHKSLAFCLFYQRRGLRIQAQPLKDTQIVALSGLKGRIFRLQVPKSSDGCLFLGCILGLILLVPELMQS